MNLKALHQIYLMIYFLYCCYDVLCVFLVCLREDFEMIKPDSTRVTSTVVPRNKWGGERFRQATV